MMVSIQDLRTIQEKSNLKELVQGVDVSIDRLT
ncbi:MAG: replication initiation protein, partial [Lactococcus lactis]